MTQIDAAPRAPGAFLTVARQEILLLWRERSLPIVALLLAALLAGGLANGLSQVRARDAHLSAIAAQQNKRFESAVEQLRAAETGGPPTPLANPRLLLSGPGSQRAVMPTLPLAPLSLGQSDLLPSHLATFGLDEARLLAETEIENPWRLATGHFDAAFVVIFLLPLLVLGLAYNLLSAEREQGTLRLLLAQPVSALSVTLGKAAARAAALATPLLALPLAALLAYRIVDDRASLLSAYLLWSALALAYALFWLALAVLVNSFGRSSAFNALALVGAWIVSTLVAPIALNLAVDTIYPTPSRTVMVELQNEATEEAARRNAELDRTDYDTLSDSAPKDGKFPTQPTAVRSVNMMREVAAAMEPWVRHFETRAAERRDFVDGLRILSPAATVFEGMNVLAGTDPTRHARFQGAVAQFMRDKAARALPRMASGEPVTEAELRAYPRFAWTEELSPDTLARGAASLAQILAPTALIGALAFARLRRLSL